MMLTPECLRLTSFLLGAPSFLSPLLSFLSSSSLHFFFGEYETAAFCPRLTESHIFGTGWDHASLHLDRDFRSLDRNQVFT